MKTETETEQKIADNKLVLRKKYLNEKCPVRRCRGKIDGIGQYYDSESGLTYTDYYCSRCLYFRTEIRIGPYKHILSLGKPKQKIGKLE